MEDEKFTHFISCLGYTVTSKNYATYRELYRNFEKFCETHNGTLEFQFICWHRQYNTLKSVAVTTTTVNDDEAQQQPLTNLQTPVLEYSPNHLPDALTKIQESCNLYTNYVLTPPRESRPVEIVMPVENPESSKCAEILQEILLQNGESFFDEIRSEVPESSEEECANHNQSQPQSRGKNIDVLKAAYVEDQINNKAKQPKRSRGKPGSARGSGRLTKDAAMLRIANYDDEEDIKTTTAMSLRELRLLTSTGDIRKKMPIYTRHNNNIDCYHIRHYSSFEFIADLRKKYLDKIKKHRDMLQHLNYLETNMLPYIEENTTT
jgi:hypothetical protein